ncbi:MAG: DUF1566 domain-containing protein, partial [Prevotella sp.]|nr:DUF1566 domain-containing protein [Prevotella sp.]
GHEYIDLGLPSGVKWATCNVGASSPSEYGDYFAWGETAAKVKYTKENCKTWEKNLGDISGNPDYDAARANWGGSWRLPSKMEIEELKEKCIWTWTKQNGYNGYKITGSNGKSIFLPAAGWYLGASLDDAKKYGGYWSSTPDESYAEFACGFSFDSSDQLVGRNYRGLGCPVRPVTE